MAHTFNLSTVIRRQKQADLCEFEVSPIYKLSSRTAKSHTEDHGLKKTKQNKKFKF